MGLIVNFFNKFFKRSSDIDNSHKNITSAPHVEPINCKKITDIDIDKHEVQLDIASDIGQIKKSYDFIVKVLLLGITSSGKSSLSTRFVDNTFDHMHMETKGVEFKIKNVKCDNKIIKMQLWDTSGHSKFFAITRAYYRGTTIFILTYDVTNENGLLDLEKFKEDLYNYSSGESLIVLVACKCDLIDKRKITTEEGKKYAASNNLKYFETSSLTGQGINDLFKYITIMLAEYVYPSAHQDKSYPSVYLYDACAR